MSRVDKEIFSFRIRIQRNVNMVGDSFFFFLWHGLCSFCCRVFFATYMEYLFWWII